MQSIEQALDEVRTLHEQLTHTPAPEIGPQSFLPFPPGADPVAFAIEEVSQLKQMLRGHAATGRAVQIAWVPRASVYAGDGGVLYVVDIPGVTRKDVTVTVTAGELTVRGERKPSSAETSLKPMVVELACGPFERRFPVPPWCNPENIAARCANGVLEINLSRSEDGTSGDFRVEIA